MLPIDLLFFKFRMRSQSEAEYHIITLKFLAKISLAGICRRFFNDGFVCDFLIRHFYVHLIVLRHILFSLINICFIIKSL